MPFPPALPRQVERTLGQLLLAGLLWAAVLLATTVPIRAAEPRVQFTHSLEPLPVVAGTQTTRSRLVATRVAAVSAAQLAAPLEFQVSLKMRNFAEFQARVGNGETVPFDEIEGKYLPLASDYNAVRRWLVGQGFRVTMDDARRLGVFATGAAAQVQTSFGVTLQSVTVAGVTYTAASTAPSLPASIAAPVLGITGLQPYLRAHRHSRMAALNATTQATVSPPYLVPTILQAYDADNLSVAGTALTGANQKIAILIDTFPLASDLTTFWSDNGIISQTTDNIEEVNVPGGTLDKTEGEESLDVEWSSSIAPGVKVRVYESDNLTFTNLNKCLTQIASDVTGTSPAQPQIHELSISLGIGEADLGKDSSTFTTEAQSFALIANGSTAYGGVSVFVSAGDDGSTPDDEGGATGPLQAEYESTDPSVTGVGGTALILDANTGMRTSEVVWDDTTASSSYVGTAGATGGGTSIRFNRPSWQTGTGVPGGNMRLAPDVSLVAAGSTPGLLIFNGGAYYVAGTSWSAPTWAGFAALINQGRGIVGRLPLGLLNPRIYPLIGTGNFYDITSGNNALGASANGNYAAGVGYDECTGIGSPDVGSLLDTLLGPTITGFTPPNGLAGASVVITGTNFYNVTSVLFNGTAAAYLVNSPTQITATAPSGVTTGPISVTALGDTTVSAASFTAGVPDLTITKSHVGGFTQADAADTYTLTVTNSGTAATSGTVTVADSLPGGLTATGLSGTGWTVASNFLSATRADALAAGGSYPPLTFTVSVSPAAAASVTNTATVAGGGETNTTNDSASDVTAIAALTPSQSWRYQYFGTTADSGEAADAANPAGDGLSNLLKYALGLDPLVPGVTPVTEDVSTGYLRLTVPKNPNATDLTYTVQVTSDLTNPAGWTTSGTTVDQNTASVLQVQDNTPVGSVPQRFIRLLISR